MPKTHYHKRKAMDQTANPQTEPPTAPPPVTSSSIPAQDVKKPFSKKWLLISAAVVIVIIVLGLVFRNNLVTREAVVVDDFFKTDSALLTVGDETIYGNEANYVAKTFYLQESRGISKAELLKKITPDLVERSLILQETSKANYLNLDASIFNSPTLDVNKRAQIIVEARRFLERQGKKMNASAITIWYYNMDPPKISVEEARRIALAKISKLQADVKSKKITMKQAGELIKADNSLSQLSPLYKNNAYDVLEVFSVKNPPFGFKELDEAIVKMKEGEVSGVIEVVSKTQIRGQNNTPMTLDERFFAVLKVEAVFNSNNESFEDWLEKKKSEIKVVELWGRASN